MVEVEWSDSSDVLFKQTLRMLRQNPDAIEVGETMVFFEIEDTSDQAIRVAKDEVDTYLSEAGLGDSFVPAVQNTTQVTTGVSDETWLEPIESGIGVGIQRIR